MFDFHRAQLTPDDHARLKELRETRQVRHAEPTSDDNPSLGVRIADIVAENVGSWRFIIIQSVMLAIWIVFNSISHFANWQWDPYPFIALNLFLSFQAAYTAPIIMMSQNRQSIIDRKQMEKDLQTNIKAELEIEALHVKMDELREKEISRLLEVINVLSKHLSPAVIDAIKAEVDQRHDAS